MVSARSLSLVALVPAYVAAQALVNTPPSLVECQPAALAWSGGTPPYYVSIIPGGQSSAAPLEQFPQTTETTQTWTVDIAAGTAITIRITDGSGQTNYSDQVSVQPGTDTSCIGHGNNSTSASSGSSGSASGSASSSGSSSGSATTHAASSSAATTHAAATTGATAAHTSGASPETSQTTNDTSASSASSGAWTVTPVAGLVAFLAAVAGLGVAA